MNPPFPHSLERTTSGVKIAWSDGSSRNYTASSLRKACPCALCREKNESQASSVKPMALPVISLAEAQPLEIRGMKPVGNYAYNIAFSDGHDSGVYTFERLYELGST